MRAVALRVRRTKTNNTQFRITRSKRGGGREGDRTSTTSRIGTVAMSGRIASATHILMNVTRPETTDTSLLAEATIGSSITTMALHPDTRPRCLTHVEILPRETLQEGARLLAMMNFVEVGCHQETTTGLPESMEAVQ